MNTDDLLALSNEPMALEESYRTSPRLFRAALAGALLQQPELAILRAWDARLNYHPSEIHDETRLSLLLTLLLCAMAGTLVKLPDFFNIDGDWFYPRFVPLTLAASLSVYFLRGTSLRMTLTVTLAFIACGVVLLMMPDRPDSDSVTMALLHMPVLAGLLLGLAYTGRGWRQSAARFRYIAYLGELLMLTSIVAFGGIVFTGLTIGLFKLIDLDIADWYFRYIAIYGAVSAPIVASFIYDQKLGRSSQWAALMANAFSPLFLVMVCVYLIAIFAEGRNPLHDRDLLILFNGLLLVVWGLAVFSISGQSGQARSRVMEVISVALLAVTLAIDSVALWAIVLRLVEFGLTPNRLCVIGTNLLVFVHLLLILRVYVTPSLRRDSDALPEVVATYLPVYGIWAAFVIVAIPMLFSFQ